MEGMKSFAPWTATEHCSVPWRIGVVPDDNITFHVFTNITVKLFGTVILLDLFQLNDTWVDSSSVKCLVALDALDAFRPRII